MITIRSSQVDDHHQIIRLMITIRSSG